MALAKNGRFRTEALVISVIVPAYNAAHTLPTCLEALAKTEDPGQPWEIIVVDDHSLDNTAQIVQEHGVQLIRHERQLGAGAARNSGIQQAKGDIICFTDADCAPTQDWLKQMIRPFTDPLITGCKGIYATHQKEWIANFVQIEYEDKYDLLRQQPYIDFIDTYSAAYRRQALIDIGGFDERIHYVEDQELSFRLAANNHKMVFQPEAIVYHRHSDTLIKYGRKKFWIGYWKAQIMRRFPERAIKDSHTPQILKIQIVLMALLLATSLFGLLWPPIWLAAFLTLAVLLLTTLPFVIKAWPKNALLALISPLPLFVRSLALGLGTFWGVIRPLPNIKDHPHLSR